jgi:hypothetical protein
MAMQDDVTRINPLDESFEEPIYGCSETYWQDDHRLSQVELDDLAKLLAQSKPEVPHA